MRRRRSRASSSRATDRGGLTSFEESFRILRSNLAVALSDLPQPTVVVTSSKEDEGKTVVCAKLALSFAQAGRRVVLVDLDLRHQTAHRLLGTHNEFGVADVLLGQRSLEDCLQYVQFPGAARRSRRGLYFLGAGGAVANPTELLGSGRAAKLLEELSGQADIVLLDTPPVLPVADTLVIGRMAAGALLVVESRTTPVGAVQQMKDLLIRNQTRLLGVVLNKFEERDASLAYGYYRFGYGYGPHDAELEDRVLADGEHRNGSTPGL